MKICAISDLHGYLPELEPCDLVLICGDIVSLKCQSDYKNSLKWYINEFATWADHLPCRKVLFIAGNHDLQIEYSEDTFDLLFPKEEKVSMLFNEEYDFEGIRIFGTPYCKQFGNWAYMANNQHLEDIYSLIPHNLDILITHDTPYGYADVLLQECNWNDGTHIGNIPLKNAILDKKPKYHFSGHLHSCEHNLTMIEDTKHYNVSLKDEFYNVVYPPLYLHIDD